MKAGFRGTFVIAWSQTELDGQRSGPLRDLAAGGNWRWTGEAVRVDGPAGVLPLGVAKGEADIRRRAAQSVRRLLRAVDADASALDQPEPVDPLFSQNFTVTDGLRIWVVTLVGMGAGRKPLLMFAGDIPPRATDLWIVRVDASASLLREPDAAPGGVICFTPGTMILTPDGPRDVASLLEGDLVQTQDNGAAEILWLGQKQLSGARLRAVPDLAPVRLRAGALDRDVPDAGLLVSPDHRVVLRGPKARTLFNHDEVLVAARDLVNDRTIMRDHSRRQVTYIHMMLPRHEIVFANGVATESFHPASAALASLQPDEQDRLLRRMPDLRGDPQAYGGFARPMLGASDAAILQHGQGRIR
ncbi:Hint domain-containing protein [Yoonia sp. 208BN28-4]|uniref:Hint domain-containing protein n=1 Tax=Yoonia sp. 208BN28-4 TaxID=3126505 RepID=UPI0030AD7C50